MNFAAAQAEVVGITKRPEKVAETASALNRALSLWTLKANWKKDLVEQQLPIDPALYGQTIDFSALVLPAVPFVRFRKFKYIRPTGQRYYLRTIEPEQVFVPGGRIQTNRYYVAGNSITFTLSQLDSSLEVGYYQYAPLLVGGTDTHWMLDMIPWVVTEKAAAMILKSIGDDQSAAFYEASSMEFFLTARRDFEDQVAAEAS